MVIQGNQCVRLCVVSFVLAVFLAAVKVSSQVATDQPNIFDLMDDQELSYFLYQQSEYPRDCLEVVSQCSSANSSGVYHVKPEGYNEVFDVYCDSEGYTIIGRRINGQIVFNRTWEEYESGFGFLSGEFRLGNKKLSYLTNQKIYQLRIDVTLKDGSTFYVTYGSFRISDSFSDYKLINTGEYDEVITSCPTNMVSGSCTCQNSCADPETCADLCHVTGSCVCPSGFLMNDDRCIPMNECGCFIAEAEDGQGAVLQESGVYISPNCAKRCSCTSGQLICDDSFQCSPHGSCEQLNNRWSCSCNEGYEGDGVQCRATYQADCQAIFNNNGRSPSGSYTIQPDWSEESFQVYCNMADGGGWTVMQRRRDGSENFFRDWDDYKTGFGSPGGEMWLGNEKLYRMTNNQRDYELRIDVGDKNGNRYYATYSSFSINSESDQYRLSSLGQYGGDSGYDALSWHLNKRFSTKDRDHDDWGSYDCAEEHQGGWWFGGHFINWGDSCDPFCPTDERFCGHFYCEYVSSYTNPTSGCARHGFGPDKHYLNFYGCAESNLNGNYGSSTRGRNIFWRWLSGYDCEIQYTEMRIRPV